MRRGLSHEIRREVGREEGRTETPSPASMMAAAAEQAMSAIERESPRPTAAEAAERTDVGLFPTLQHKHRRNWRIVAILSGILVALVCTLGEMLAGGIVAVVAGLVLITMYVQSSRELTNYYKSDIVPQFVTLFCDSGHYAPDEGIGRNVFMSSHLFSKHPDRYETEDLVTGRIGATKFRFAEIHAQEKRTIQTRNGTKTTYIDIFRGFFFVADFNKHFRGRTVMTPNFPGAKWLAGRDRVSLENQELMRRFIVCSTDQIEARYILTPGLMERIMGLWERYPGKLSISFSGSCIMVARTCLKNHYEAGLWRSLRRCIVRDTEAVCGLTAIVEELNMNTRIWTKA